MSATKPSPAINPNTTIVATAGHVDHGKSALVRSLTGKDTDTLAEEKKRGLTINLGYAYSHFQRSDGEAAIVGFVDVPGHTDFINNMLVGVGAVDAALLVIAADDGIMPQTREHLAILQLLQLRRGAVVITKCDKVDDSHLEALGEELDQLLADSLFEDSQRFRVSNISGAGIEALREYLQALGEPQSEGSQQPPRFLIDRAFTVKGLGTVVTGSLRSGTLQKDQSLCNSATGKAVRLRGIRLDQTELEAARSGQRVALNLSCELEEVGRGDWLLLERYRNPTLRYDAQLELLDPSLQIKPSGQYHLYHGATHAVVSLRPLQDGGRFYQLRSNVPLFAFYGDRFVIRDPAAERTLGGGTILDGFVPRRGRSSEGRLAELEAMSADPAASLLALSEASEQGANLPQFADNRQLEPAPLEDILQQPMIAAATERLSLDKPPLDRLLPKERIDRWRQDLLKTVAMFHQQHADQQGLSLPKLAELSEFPASLPLLQALLANMVAAKQLLLTGTLIHLPGHQTKLSAEQQDFLDKVRPLLQKAGWIAPRTRELVEQTGIPLKALERILDSSRRQGSLIKIADNRYYLPETIAEIAEFTEGLASDETEGFSVIQFRDASEIGRNLCVEILEYFDGIGYTRRDGNSRFLRTSKDNLFKP